MVLDGSEKPLSEVISFLDEKTRPELAEQWDNVGLLVGDPTRATQGAVVSIDLTPETIQEAKNQGYRLIINHHPCLFPRDKGMNRLVSGQTSAEIPSQILWALEQGMAIYAAHTNFDQAATEVVEAIAQGLELSPQGRLLDGSHGDWLTAGIVSGEGYGFYGDFSQAVAFSDMAQCVTRLFQASGYLVTEPVPDQVKRLGYAPGKGASFIQAAEKAGCDVFITGEAGYHHALEGARQGMAVMEIGHRDSERFFHDVMETWLSELGLVVTKRNVPMQRFGINKE